MRIEDIHKPATTDDEIWEFIIQNVIHPSPGVVGTALTELSLRSQAATRESIKSLRQSIEAFNTSSDRYSRKIVRLTWVLIALTIILVFLTFVLAYPIVKPSSQRPKPGKTVTERFADFGLTCLTSTRKPDQPAGERP